MKCFFFFLSLWVSIARGLEIPQLTGPVVDEGGLFTQKEERALSGISQKIKENGIAQIQVLTIQSLLGEPIENYSIAVTDQWKLGGEKSDNGILILVAVEDRKIRIEVGQGLEGSVPDAVAGRIIRQVITPQFKQRNYAEGIAQAMLSLVSQVAGEERAQNLLPSEIVPQRKKGREGWNHIIIFIIILLYLISGRFRRSRVGAFGAGYGLGSLGSGRGGGGGFGGGGWSGGGGGFSGGGASGNW